jgi:hypothetical protein
LFSAIEPAHARRCQLCKLLEAEFTAPGNGREDSRNISVGKRFRLADADIEVDLTLEDTAPPPIFNPKLLASREQRILYEDFRAKYWPHFPQFGTKGLGLLLLLCSSQGCVFKW